MMRTPLCDTKALALILVCATTRSMGQGCEAPIAVLTDPVADTLRICAGSSVTFDGSASTAAPGLVVEQWVWAVTGQGAETTTSSSIEIPFLNAGVVFVSLTVIDAVGCASEAFAQRVVLVNGLEHFGTDVDGAHCSTAGPITLHAAPVAAPMLTIDHGCAEFSEPEFLPDGSVTEPIFLVFESDLVLDAPGATLNNVEQLEGICLTMEHSWLSDLNVIVVCPNGQEAVLLNGGSIGSFVGEPVDGDDDEPVLGVCYTYCFSYASDLGRLADVWGSIPIGVDNTIPPGTYLPIEPLDSLIGCPLNGVWSLHVFDDAFEDNGFLCDWCVDLAGEPTSLEGPFLGTSADSSFWSGTAVVNDPDQPGTASAIVNTPGVHEFVYSVIDDHGCVHDTTIAVTIISPPVVGIQQQGSGLVCATPDGLAYYQWSFNGEIVPEASGSCFNPPFAGIVGVQAGAEPECTGSAELVITGMHELHGSTPRFGIFPNPCQGSFSLSYAGFPRSDLWVRVADMTGRVLNQIQLTFPGDGRTIPVDLVLAPGVYTVHVLDTHGGSSARVVVN